jgi:glyoxylase-like metal-dependent hydrolase (beta-lactamase superfamily II)
MNPNIEAVYDPVTGTVSYVVYDRAGGRAALIDPVLDYDFTTGKTGTVSAGKLMQCVRDNRLAVDWILETHAHADHLSAAHYLKRELGGKIAIGSRIGQVQKAFKRLFNLEDSFPQDGSQFDHLFADDETFSIGALTAKAIFVPGHTPADMAYQIGDAVFVGDTLFMPDVGTARCDFPGGDAPTLFRSISKLLALPDETRLFMCHDYPPDGREPVWQSSVARQREGNIHVGGGISEEAFVSMRRKRDASLAKPVLILPSIQVNIRAGQMPDPESNGIRYLKIPLDAL